MTAIVGMNMSKIQISRSKVDSNTSECYAMLVLFFDQVQIMSRNNVGGWSLDECYTNTEHGEFITSYSNGRIKVKAHSVDGDHNYSVESI